MALVTWPWVWAPSVGDAPCGHSDGLLCPLTSDVCGSFPHWGLMLFDSCLLAPHLSQREDGELMRRVSGPRQTSVPRGYEASRPGPCSRHLNKRPSFQTPCGSSVRALTLNMSDFSRGRVRRGREWLGAVRAPPCVWSATGATGNQSLLGGGLSQVRSGPFQAATARAVSDQPARLPYSPLRWAGAGWARAGLTSREGQRRRDPAAGGWLRLWPGPTPLAAGLLPLTFWQLEGSGRWQRLRSAAGVARAVAREVTSVRDPDPGLWSVLSQEGAACGLSHPLALAVPGVPAPLTHTLH